MFRSISKTMVVVFAVISAFFLGLGVSGSFATNSDTSGSYGTYCPGPSACYRR